MGLQENIELGGQNMSSYIEVKNVSKSFSGRAILQNISLPVEQGTTVGLVGANGSGKSVLFKIICGFEKPDQGSVYVRGNQLGKNGCDFPESLGVFINSPWLYRYLQWFSKSEIPCGHSRENWRKRNPTGHEQSRA